MIRDWTDSLKFDGISAEAERLFTRLVEGSSLVSAALEGTTQVRSTHDLVVASLARFEDRVKGRLSPMGIPTLPDLDHRLRGMHPGRLWVIGAYPSGGKSLLASQIVTDAAMEGVPSAYITLEMSEDDQTDRMLIQAGRVDSKTFMDPGKVPAVVFLTQTRAGAKRLVDSKIQVVRPPKRTLGMVLGAIYRVHRELGAKVIAIDYFQLITVPGKKARTREDEASEISHALQNIAGELGVTLLILTQLNADGDTKHGRVIEEDADVFLTIDQDRNRESETYKNHTGMTLVKDRHTGCGGERIPLFLNRSTLRFQTGTFPDKGEKQSKRRTR
ncbi:MAG: replicative helicase [Akkermansiaceae bacterium]|nr:replicative helicase [Akkermansiaceae bacterium]